MMRSQADAVRQFMNLRPRTAASDEPANVIVVAAGKGGVGTSTVSLLLGIGVAAQGVETLVVDAGDPPGSLIMLLNATEPAAFAAGRETSTEPDAFAAARGTPSESGALQSDAALRRVAPGLTLAVPAAELAGQSEAERRIRYRRLAATYGEYGCVIVDAGARFHAITMALATASRLLLVCTADRVAVTATFALLKHARSLDAAAHAGVIVNRSNREQADRAIGALRAGSERFLRAALATAVAVPEDAQLAACLNEGSLLADASATAASTALQPLVLQVATNSTPAFLPL